jgi:hypothetical protein
MRGEKGRVHENPGDPPRRRANQVRGHGSFEGDRSPVAGVAGRGSGKLRLAVVDPSVRATLEGFVVSSTREGSLV